MTNERTIKGGSFRETFTNTATPEADNSKAPHPRLTSASPQCEVFAKFDIAGIRKQTVTSGVLRVKVKGTWASQTVTFTPVDERMTLREVKSGNEPTLRTGEAVAVVTGAKSDGQYVEIDIEDFLQTLADGAKNHGFKLSTSSGADNRIYGTESKYKNQTWEVVYSVAERPDPPTNLSPNGSTVATPLPVLSSDFRDPGGESKVLAALQVQIGHMSGSTFISDWESDETDTSRPRLKLVDTDYTGLPEGSAKKWRMRHKDAAGYWSPWSDPAEVTYDLPAIITVTNPLDGLVFDCSPTLSIAVSDGVAKAYRLQVYKTNRATTMLYDSRKRDGNDATTISHRVPFRDKETRKRILRDDTEYVALWRVWDNNDREATPGHPAYVYETVFFTVDDDVEQVPPDALHAAQIGDTPRVRLTWPIPGGYAEGYVIWRNGTRIARLEPDEVTIDVDNTIATWIDIGALPNRENTYRVQAIYDGAQTTKSPAAGVTPIVNGVWLFNDDVEAVLDGIDLDGFTATEKSATHELLNAPYDVEIIYGLRGVTGGFTGTFGSSKGRDWEATYDALMSMRIQPDSEIRLAYGTINKPVLASISEPMPDGRIQRGNMLHKVSFTAKQSDDFDETTD